MTEPAHQPDREAIRRWRDKMAEKARRLGWRKCLMSEWHWDLRGTDKPPEELICEGITKERFESHSDSIVWELAPAPGDAVLNLGCGIGRVEKFLGPRVDTVHAVDFSEEMIGIARTRLADLQNVHFHVNDGATIPMIATGSIDLAFSELLFQHIPPHVAESYIGELHRVLKPGGRCILQIPTRGTFGDMPPELCSSMSREEVLELIAGFTEISFSARYTNDSYWTPIATR